MSVPARIMRVELLGADRGRAARVLDEFAERLARHVDAGEQFEAGRGPGGGAAVEKAEIVIAGGGEHRGGARAEAVIVVDQHDAGIITRHQASEAQFQPAQRHIARPQQMIAREDQFLAHIDQRQFAAVAEHGFDGGGGEGAKRIASRHDLSASRLVPGHNDLDCGKLRRLLRTDLLHRAGVQIDPDAGDLFEIGAGDADEARGFGIVDRVNGSVLVDAGMAGR